MASLYRSLFENKVRKLEGLQVTLTEAEAPRLALLLPELHRLKNLRMCPATPGVLLLALEAVDTVLMHGGLKQLTDFYPDDTEHGNYTPETVAKLVAILPKLKALKFFDFETMNPAELGVEQMTTVLLSMPTLKTLRFHPTTPAALLLFLEAVDAAVTQGGLETVRNFVPDNSNDSNYSTEAWPKLMSLFPKLKNVDSILLDFKCGATRFPCDNEAQEFAELLESGSMANLTQLKWYNGTGHGKGYRQLQQVTSRRNIQLV